MHVVDRHRLDFEMGRRGLSAEELAKRAGVQEATVSRIRAGKPTRAATIRKLVEALAQCPALPIADGLLAENKDADRALPQSA